MFQLHEIKAHATRLDGLVRGLAHEVVVVKADDGSLLYAERKACLAALHRAVEGLDEARVAMPGVVKRMEGR